VSFDLVIPSAGRATLGALLDGVLAGDGPCPERIVVVDDRADAEEALVVPAGVEVVRGPARGPAAARNVGWRAGAAEWVVFLDDDVIPEAGWRATLAAELAGAGADVGGVQGRVVVPLPRDRRPTDWERNTAGLEHARWATADLAYRRAALAAVGGFDERFPRAYREDADLGLRVCAVGWRIVMGARTVRHPVRPAPASVSLAKQAGNADDVLMRALHGRDWRERAGVPAGRRPRHLAVAAAGAVAVGALPARAPRVALAAGAVWAAGTAELAWARIAPGPRTRDEVATMAWTSALLPFAASGWWLAGHATLRRRLRAAGPEPDAAAARTEHAVPGDIRPSRAGSSPADTDVVPVGAPQAVSDASPEVVPRGESDALPAAVLFDRDGTLVLDVPHNGDPALVEPVPGARAALDRLRAAGVPTAVVSNQSGIARGLLTEAEVAAVNARVEGLLGPLGPWAVCPHGPDDGCPCRKPAPGLVLEAAARLGVDARRCVVIGDIGADVEAARAAGARGILVPTPRTLPEEVAAADEVAADLAEAVDMALAARAVLEAAA
jgi:histidinol-phosphate phosphatase family protein